MDHKKKAVDGLLPIRLRQVFDGEGGVHVSKTVYCPPREASLPLDACLACECATEVLVDTSGRTPSSLRCSEADAPPAARAARSRLDIAVLAPVAEIMTRDVACADQDADVAIVEAMLAERGISGMPVVDALGRPVGVISRADLLRDAHERTDAPAMPRGAPAIRRVRDVMTPRVISLPERAPIALAAALMASESVHRLPLVDGDGAVVGLVSTLDIARWLAAHTGYVLTSRSP